MHTPDQIIKEINDLKEVCSKHGVIKFNRFYYNFGEVVFNVTISEKEKASARFSFNEDGQKCLDIRAKNTRTLYSI